jgi:hypothetical protein
VTPRAIQVPENQYTERIGFGITKAAVSMTKRGDEFGQHENRHWTSKNTTKTGSLSIYFWQKHAKPIKIPAYHGLKLAL